jgi:uncharacterized repeat protein (TIGR03803 family)
MTPRRSVTRMNEFFLLCVVVAASSASAQTFTSLLSFDGSNGHAPAYVTLMQARNGSLWGTASRGSDAAFEMTTQGVTKPFPGISTAYGLILGVDNSYYGVTALDGSSDRGTIYKLDPAGTLATLFNFNVTDGSEPIGPLAQGVDGDFYGTTSQGGTGNCSRFGMVGCGTIFKLTRSGTLTTLFDFDADSGWSPTALVQGTDGSFYGSTAAGGVGSQVCKNGCGTIFRITPGGAFRILYNFNFSVGIDPVAGLVQGTDGNFYGTAERGGISDASCPLGCGTIFKITPTGTVTTLYTFTGGSDGGNPEGPLTEGTDGNFYGTTSSGGNYQSTCGFGSGLGCGTLFQITPLGFLTTLHSFSLTDGATAEGGLVQHTSGVFFGTTYAGGNLSGSCGIDVGCGTLFSLDVGLAPFIKTTTTTGKVGTSVQILGQGLTGTSAVTFSVVLATSFKVVSDTFMTAVIPVGATSGPVQVTTPSGILTSNVSFVVRP